MNGDGTDNIVNNKSDTPGLSAAPPDKDPSENESPANINSSELPVTQDAEHEPPDIKKENQPYVKPSLSSAVKKPKKYLLLLHNAVQCAVGIAVGVGMGYLLLYLVMPGLLTVSRLFYFLLFLIISLFLNLNLYKAGELISGCACGGKVAVYQFTCLHIYRFGEKFRRRFTFTHSFEGQCALLPPSDRPYLAKLYIAFYTGGVTACAFAGCFCIITAICLTVTVSGMVLFSERNAPFIMFLWINGVFALLYAVVCLIPVFWGDSPSDGSILSALIKKSPYTAHLIKLRSVTAQLAAGIRPSDLKIPDIIPVSVTKKKSKQKTASFGTQKKRSLLSLKRELLFYYICRLPIFKIKTPDKTVSDEFTDSADVITAAEILDTAQSDEPEDETGDNIPEKLTQPDAITEPEVNEPETSAVPEKKKKICCRRGRYMGDLEIKMFPEPKESDNKLSACSLLLKIYNYYIALDNAERGDMQTYLRQIEENIIRVPTQLLPRVCRELCFYYSIDKNLPAAAHYMEMMDSLPKQRDCIDDLRVRAFFEMYIKRRHKTAFSLCRDALETPGPDTDGLTAMNRELIKGLVILIHQKSVKSEA